MPQYTLKSALVAELKSIKTTARIKAEIASANSNVTVAALWSGKENVCNELLSLLDTFEIKEVDLESNVDKILEEHDWNYNKIDFYKFAKHFFELGLQAQKGE